MVNPSRGIQLPHHCVNQREAGLSLFPGIHFFSLELIPINGFAHFVSRISVPILNRSREEVEHLPEKQLPMQGFRRFAMVARKIAFLTLLPQHADGETTGAQIRRQTGGARFQWGIRFVGRSSLGLSERVDEINLPRNFLLQPGQRFGFSARKIRIPGLNFSLQRSRQKVAQFIA